jgi:very-short-patch-repair endonuclease
MPLKHIVTGQPISPSQSQFAKELRHNMTAAEWILWKYLRAGRLEGFHFRRQQIIDRFFVDFYCHATALVIEVDGGIHTENEAYDQERDQYLQSLGLRILRFTNNDVNHHIEAVLTSILEACKAELD